MKGGAVTVAVLIFTFLSIMTIATSTLYRYRITVEVNYQYNYNNVQLALLTFLSSTHEKEQMSKILGEHVSMNRDLDSDIVREKLDKIIATKCYGLTVGDFSVNGTNTECDKKYSSIYKLPYPYNPRNITGDVTLVVG